MTAMSACQGNAEYIRQLLRKYCASDGGSYAIYRRQAKDCRPLDYWSSRSMILRSASAQLRDVSSSRVSHLASRW